MCYLSFNRRFYPKQLAAWFLQVHLLQTPCSWIKHQSHMQGFSNFALQLLLLVTFSCHLLNLILFNSVLEILSNKNLLFKNWNCVKYMEIPILSSSLSLIQTCQQRHLMLSFVSIQTTTVNHITASHLGSLLSLAESCSRLICVCDSGFEFAFRPPLKFWGTLCFEKQI